MKTSHLSLFVTCLVAGLLVGCPEEPNPLGEFRNDSNLRVSVDRVLGQESVPLTRFGTALVVPADGFEVWVEPLARRVADNEAVSVSWKEARVLYEMGDPAWGGQVVEEKYVRETGRNDGGLISSVNFSSVVSGLALLASITSLFSGGVDVDVDTLLPWWRGPAIEYWRGTPSWLIAPGCWYYGSCWGKGGGVKTANLPNGKWLNLFPVAECDRITVSAVFTADKAEDLSVSFLLQVDADNDGWPNWLERQEGSDPYDPESVPEEPIETVEVPDLTGLTEQQARDTIATTCLTVGTVTSASSNTVPSGQVISWSPTGTQSCGTTVNFVVSTGPAIVTVSVPDLSGLNWSQAEALVEPLGLSIPDSGVTTEASNTVPANIIIRWSPTSSVPVGTTISIVVSTGPVVVPPPFRVQILSPAGGQIFSVGQSVTITARITGDPAKGPFRLVLSCAGKSLPTQVFTGLSSGDERSATFELTLPGTAWFNAYLEDKDGSYATDGVAYSVTTSP
jgi:hypothetical protein